jgi:heat shock protein HslJ
VKPLFLVTTFCVILFGLVSCTCNDTITQFGSEQLKNVQWRFTAFSSQGGIQVTLNSTDTIFLNLQDSGITRGRSFGLCRNSYSGQYSFGDRNSITFNSLGSTEMACPNSRYSEYLQILSNVRDFEFNITGDNLYLCYDFKTKKLVFKKTI